MPDMMIASRFIMNSFRHLYITLHIMKQGAVFFLIFMGVDIHFFFYCTPISHSNKTTSFLLCMFSLCCHNGSDTSRWRRKASGVVLSCLALGHWDWIICVLVGGASMDWIWTLALTSSMRFFCNMALKKSIWFSSKSDPMTLNTEGRKDQNYTNINALWMVGFPIHDSLNIPKYELSDVGHWIFSDSGFR